MGVYRLLTGGCFRCGSTDRLIAQCPRESGDNRNLQESGRGKSVTLPLTRDRGRGRGVPIQHRGRGGTISETVDCPIPSALARAYAIKARGDQDAPEVVAGIFSLYDIEMHALIDPGFTHSYVCIEHVFDKIPVMEQLACDQSIGAQCLHE